MVKGIGRSKATPARAGAAAGREQVQLSNSELGEFIDMDLRGELVSGSEATSGAWYRRRVVAFLEWKEQGGAEIEARYQQGRLGKKNKRSWDEISLK